MTYIPYYVKEFDTAQELESFLNDEKRKDVQAPRIGVRRIKQNVLGPAKYGTGSKMEVVTVDVYYVIGRAEK